MSLYKEIYNFFNEEEEDEKEPLESELEKSVDSDQENKDRRGRTKTTYPVTLSIEGEDDKYMALSAGRILSLIRTDPSKSNISFDDIEEDRIYKIKKKIKKGPGGYIITDEDADKEINISVDDKTRLYILATAILPFAEPIPV